MKKKSISKKTKTLVMSIASLCVAVGAISISSYAWFSTLGGTGNIFLESGDLKINSAVFTYYRWQFPINESGVIVIDPSIFDQGEAVSGSISYASDQTETVVDLDNAHTMNMYDPYISRLFDDTDFKTRQFIKVTSSITTACDFDLSLSAIVTDSYVYHDTSSYHDLLSKYIVFKALPESSVTLTDPNDLDAIYSDLDTAFSEVTTTYSFSNENKNITIASINKVIGATVIDETTVSKSYYVCLDYNKTLLDNAYTDIDLYNKYVLEQDYVYQISAIQNGI